MDILIIKILAIILIFSAGLSGGLLQSTFKKRKRLIILGNAFAAGIFLGAGLIHLLHDSQSTFSQIGYTYPIGFLLAGFAVLLILWIKNTLASKAFNPYLLFLILSLHSIIAGLALGLENSILTAIAIFFALFAHKGSAAFALGTTLKTRYWNTIAIFSCMTPLGIILGTFGTQLQNALVFEAAFDGLAAGTFLYISLLDIIPEVKAKKGAYTLIALGIGVMALLAIWS